MTSTIGQFQPERPAPGSSVEPRASDASEHLHLREMIRAASQAALRSLHSDGAAEERDGARTAFRECCALARTRGVRVEQLILMIRDGWYRLPELRGVPRLDAVVSRARVVTLCIEEYYEPRAGS